MNQRNKLPELEYLHECFLYDPVTGLLTWRVRPVSHFSSEAEYKRFNTSLSGREAGRLKRDGYREVRLNGTYYSVHRLCYFMATGEEPEVFVDHINGVKDDNRLCNLRLADATQNNHNRRISRNNTTGYKGVSVDSKYNRFKSSIRVGGGRRIFLGYFDTAEEAHDAYQAAAKEYHKDFAYSIDNQGDLRHT